MAAEVNPKHDSYSVFEKYFNKYGVRPVPIKVDIKIKLVIPQVWGPPHKFHDYSREYCLRPEVYPGIAEAEAIQKSTTERVNKLFVGCLAEATASCKRGIVIEKLCKVNFCQENWDEVAAVVEYHWEADDNLLSTLGFVHETRTQIFMS